jgi:fructokinase
MLSAALKTIVCFGEVLWDILPRGAQPGGAPMNVAIHLKRQGINPWLVSRIGFDAEGEKMKQYLIDSGLNLQFIQTDNDLPTSKVLVHLDLHKNATYEICEPVAWDNIQLPHNLDKLAEETDLIVFGTLASRNEVTQTTLLQFLQKTNAVKLLDVNLRPPYDRRELVEDFLYRANFVKLNDEELAKIALWNGVSGNEAALIHWLAEYYKCPSVCVTRGAKGAVLLWDGKLTEHSGFRVNAIDTVGSGDSFLAGLIARLSGGKSPEDALEYACATGAFVASQNGAVPEYFPEEIETLIHR